MTKNRLNKRIKLTQDILVKIAKIDQFKGLWQGSMRLSPQILGRLKALVIITSTGASTRIEGARMTDKEVARLLRGLQPKGRDEQEVAGYADLLGRVFNNYTILKLTEGHILQFHSILLKFSEKDQIHRGKYKNLDNVVMARNEKGEQVTLFRPTPPYLVKKEMDDALAWTNEKLAKGEIHPILVIADFMFEFLAILPFQDGNGRLSHVLTNLLLLKMGYTYVPYVSLEEIIEETKTEYYLSLRATQKNHKTSHENITPWVGYLLDTLLEQTERARQLIESAEPEKLLSERQLQILRLFDKGQTLGVAGIDKALRKKMPKATIKQALSRLVALKLLERIGQARSTRYKKM